MKTHHIISGGGRFFTALCTLACTLALLLSLGPAALADELDSQTTEIDDTTPSRLIAFVFDDSGSMTHEANTRDGMSTKWAAAEYSLEALAAMLNEKDHLEVFCMTDQQGNNKFDPFSIEGSWDGSRRVETIAKKFDDYSSWNSWTSSKTVEDAYLYLSEKGSAYDECVLIVFTDGEWTSGSQYGGGATQVLGVVANCQRDGIEVIGFAVGEKSNPTIGGITHDPAHGVYLYQSDTKSQNILQKMTEIANLVFGRANLPSSALRGSSLTLDIPVSQLIVFAQGADASVGALISSEKAVEASATKVKYPEPPSKGALPQGCPKPFITDTTLQGVVAVFDCPLPAGTYSLDVEADNVSVYYTPRVDIEINFIDAELGISHIVKSDEDLSNLPAGTYTFDSRFLDPDTGEELTSDLLKPYTLNLTVRSGGSSQTYEDGETVTLSRGRATVMAKATLPGNVVVRQSYSASEIQPAPKGLVVNASDVKGVLTIGELDGYSAVVTVAHEDGSPLTAEEWNLARLDVNVLKDKRTGLWSSIWYEVLKGAIGQFEVTAHYLDNSERATSDELFGKIALSSITRDHSFAVTWDDGLATYAGSDIRPITYKPNLLNTLIRWLWLLILLLLLLAFIIMELLKPRLPKLKPHIDLNDGDNPWKLRYNNRVAHRIWPPWSPETTNLDVRVSGHDASQFELSKKFRLSSVGLVAVRPGGFFSTIPALFAPKARRFAVDEKTLETMKKHEAGQVGFPEPEYSCLKSNKLSVNSSIRFTGNAFDRRGRRRDEEYKIKFR